MRTEHALALEQFARGQQLAPSDAELLSEVSGSELSLGRAQEALRL